MKNIKAFLIDLVLWTYTVLVLWKLVQQQLYHEELYIEFQSEELYLSLLTALVLGSVLFVVKGFSVGKYFYKQTPGYSATPTKFFLAIVLFLTLLSGWVITGMSFVELFSSKGFRQAMHLFSELFSPDFSILPKVLQAAVETIYMAMMATVLAIPPAFVLSFFTARNLMQGTGNKLIYFLARLCMNITRSIEPLIWAIIFSVWVGIGPFAGMLALMIHSIVSLAKLYSEQIEEMDNGPMEAIKATGASNVLVILYGIVPQIINPFLSFTIYRWDINVRMATIIGMVGGGGIGNILMQYQGMARWHQVGTVIVVIAVIVWVMDFASAKIREKLK